MKLCNLIVLSLIFAVAPPALAKSDAELYADVKDAVGRLGAQRGSEALERAELGAKVTSIEGELLVLRRQSDLARLKAEGRRDLLAKLKREKRGFEQDSQYFKGIYRDFSVQLASQLKPGQKQLYEVELEKTSSIEASLLERSNAFDVAMDRLESLLGGEVLIGNAVDDDGKVLDGKVCNVGPSTWFLSNDGNAAGVLVLGKGSKYARLISEAPSSVNELFANGVSNLQVDVTGGKARAIEQIQGDSSQLFKKGGVWLWPILGIALISVVCGVMKFIQLLGIKEPAPLWIAGILTSVRGGDLDEARINCSSVKHPVGTLIQNALEYVDAGADVVEEVIYEQLIGVQSNLQKWLPFIAVTAATAPLLGLLGTVSGMIRMFNVITVVGTGDVKPMAGGISEALVTTLFGLVVAIPALIIHTMLQRRSNGVVQNTEKLGLTFVNGLRKLD